MQGTWFLPPPSTAAPAPLLVVLHTWSFDMNYPQPRGSYLPMAVERGWAFLAPDFRGPNKRPEACGSDLAVQDVLDAVAWAKANARIDDDRVFVAGPSGGGHMALLAAAAAPELFRAVEAWCPVSDLVGWHRFLTETRQHYVRDLEACVGGPPETCPEEYARRSPATHPERLKDLPVSIHHGRHDDTVPFAHSRDLARKLEAAGNDRVYLDIFDGGHEQFPTHSFEWFAKLADARSASVRITG